MCVFVYFSLYGQQMQLVQLVMYNGLLLFVSDLFAGAGVCNVTNIG